MNWCNWALRVYTGRLAPVENKFIWHFQDGGNWFLCIRSVVEVRLELKHFVFCVCAVICYVVYGAPHTIFSCWGAKFKKWIKYKQKLKLTKKLNMDKDNIRKAVRELCLANASLDFLELQEKKKKRREKGWKHGDYVEIPGVLSNF